MIVRECNEGSFQKHRRVPWLGTKILACLLWVAVVTGSLALLIHWLMDGGIANSFMPWWVVFSLALVCVATLATAIAAMMFAFKREEEWREKTRVGYYAMYQRSADGKSIVMYIRDAVDATDSTFHFYVPLGGRKKSVFRYDGPEFFHGVDVLPTEDFRYVILMDDEGNRLRVWADDICELYECIRSLWPLVSNTDWTLPFLFSQIPKIIRTVQEASATRAKQELHQSLKNEPAYQDCPIR
jgi:hypothetical protein